MATQQTLLPTGVKQPMNAFTSRSRVNDADFSVPGIRGLLFCLLIVMSGGCKKTNESAGGPPKKTSPPVAVKTVSVQQRTVQQTTRQPAVVRPYFSAGIRPRVSGYIAEVLVDMGDVVQKDQPLAVISIPEVAQQRAVLVAQLERSRSEEERAAAAVELAAASVLSAVADVDQARSQLKAAEAAVAAAEAEFQRIRDLVQRQSLEPRVLDEVRRKRDTEIAHREALQSAVQAAEALVEVAKARKSVAEAQSRTATADRVIIEQQLAELDVQMSFATLTAPFAGVVTARNAEPGSLASDKSELALFEVSQIDKVRIHVHVPERDAPFVNRNDTMTLSFPAFSNEPDLQTKVARTSQRLDPATKMLLVEAVMDNPDAKLLPGMFGQATIELHRHAEVATLPARAVRFTETGDAYVYAVSNETVRVVPVTTGMDDGKSIHIAGGVNAGQTVIDAHLQRFTDGQRVRVLNQKPTMPAAPDAP